VGGEDGHRVAGDVLLEQDLLALAGTVVGAQRGEVRLEARALVDTDAQVVDQLGPGVLHVEPLGHDVDVVRGAAGGEHLAVAIANDAPRGGQGHPAHDVLVGDGLVLFGVQDLELEEAADEAEEEHHHGQADPAEAPPELADVGTARCAAAGHARPQTHGHGALPSPGRSTVPALPRLIERPLRQGAAR
jgi:hypothetical protein